MRAWAILALLTATPLFAGPPLICHPYDIGTAKSLPGGNEGHGVSGSYDRKNLVPDTLALLTPETPVLVRMETLRRAAIYATANLRGWGNGRYTGDDRAFASALLEKLRERSKAATGQNRATALFDLGFYSETLKQTGIDPTLDGYTLIVKALELRGPDPEMEFALAVASASPKRPEQAGHLAKARNAAPTNALLAANLSSHF